MRFMQFRAKDSYSLALSKLEKVSGVWSPERPRLLSCWGSPGPLRGAHLAPTMSSGSPLPGDREGRAGRRRNWPDHLQSEPSRAALTPRFLLWGLNGGHQLSPGVEPRAGQPEVRTTDPAHQELGPCQGALCFLPRLVEGAGEHEGSQRPRTSRRSRPLSTAPPEPVVTNLGMVCHGPCGQPGRTFQCLPLEPGLASCTGVPLSWTQSSWGPQDSSCTGAKGLQRTLSLLKLGDFTPPEGATPGACVGASDDQVWFTIRADSVHGLP